MSDDALTGGPSPGNTTTTPLGTSETFTGTAEKSLAPDVMVSCQTDQAGTLYFDFSNDNVNFSTFPVNGFAVAAGIHEFHTALKGPRWFRVRMVNGADGAQTYLRFYTYFGRFRQPNAPHNQAISQDADSIVTRTDDEEAVMRGRVSGEYIISKFGQNSDVDAAEDIWEGGGNYTGFPTAAAEQFEIVCANVADDNEGTGAQSVRLYYFNDDYEMFDSSGNFLTVDVATNGNDGANGITLSGVTGMRIWRAKVILSGSGQINAGTITVRWTSTTSAIFAAIPAGVGQTLISNFTVPAGYTGWLKRYQTTMRDNNTNDAEMAIKVRDFGSNTFRLIRQHNVSTDRDGGPGKLYGGAEFAEKTDFIFRCTDVTNANGIITADWAMRLSKNVT